MQRWPGTLRASIVLRLADPRIESVGESRLVHLCWLAGLPAPVPQVEVHDDHSRLLGRADLAWPDLGVWVEFDGLEKYHRYRRPGESIEQMVLREKRREDEMREATGWRCIRTSWRDLENPQALIARLRALLTPTAAVG